MNIYKNVDAIFVDLIKDCEKKLSITLSDYSKIYLIELLKHLATNT